MTTVGWILNLDADLELAAPVRPSRSSRAADHGGRFLAVAGTHAGASIHHCEASELRAAPDLCQAWCPTPGARVAAGDMGLDLPPAPSLTVLQTVNHRSFAADLGSGLGADPGLPGASFVWSMDELEAVLAGPLPPGGWLLKRPFGFSGRGRKHLASALQGGDRRWAEASMEGYGRGLQVEPFVTTEAEFALHGWLRRDGSGACGDPTTLLCAPDGSWLESRPAGAAIQDDEAASLLAAFARVRRALLDAGYFGPFGIDAFRWRDADGARHFHSLGDLNARYTMGFFVGLGARQAGLWSLEILG